MSDLIALAIGPLAIALHWYRGGFRFAGDSATYLMAAAGHRVARPFNRRWLVPELLSPLVPTKLLSPVDQATVAAWAERDCLSALRWWMVVSLGALATTPWLVAQLAERWLPGTGLVAALLFAFLPGFRQLVRWPWMADQIALALALTAALLPWWAAMPVALVASAAHERAGVFSAIWAMNPWIVPAAMAASFIADWRRCPGEVMLWEKGIVDEPWASARRVHGAADQQLALRYVLPWGLCLVGLSGLTLLGWVAMAAAYAQLLVAVDRTRLYLWGAPMLVASAAMVVASWPAWVIGLALALHVAWPWGEAQL